MIKAAPGQAESIRAPIESLLKRYPNGKLQDRAQFKAAQAKQITQLLNLIYALLMMAIIIAVFGIGNTLALSIFERTHEIGLLRAVGMTRAQVRSVVRWEAVIIALFGTLLGLLIGVFFGWVLVQALKDQGISELSLPAGSLAGAGRARIAGRHPGRMAAGPPGRQARRPGRREHALTGRSIGRAHPGDTSPRRRSLGPVTFGGRGREEWRQRCHRRGSVPRSCASWCSPRWWPSPPVPPARVAIRRRSFRRPCSRSAPRRST